jgi:hypothetical protein
MSPDPPGLEEAAARLAAVEADNAVLRLLLALSPYAHSRWVLTTTEHRRAHRAVARAADHRYDRLVRAIPTQRDRRGGLHLAARSTASYARVRRLLEE